MQPPRLDRVIQPAKDDGVSIRFNWEPNAWEEFYVPRHWFGNVTEPDTERRTEAAPAGLRGPCSPAALHAPNVAPQPWLGYAVCAR